LWRNGISTGFGPVVRQTIWRWVLSQYETI